MSLTNIDTLGQTSDIADIQAVILDIYKEFKRICDTHGLRYFAIGGTCIGAVRHGGFIPWDDDMDIAMPDTDYDEFFRIAPAELPPHLKVLICNEQPHSSLLFNKIHNINTAFIENNELPYPAEYKGIYLDIMPLCGFPAEQEARIKLEKKIRFLARINRQRHQRYSVNTRLMSKALWLLTRPFDFLIPVDHWIKVWKRLISRHPYDDSSFVGYAWSPRLAESRVYPKAYFDEYIDLPFHDTLMRCPAGYDQILTAVFGDYMTPPPADKQIMHSWGIVSPNHSFTNYRS